ncbi:MAG: hypothetical protein WBC14_00375 [Propionicimonas sp.]
MSEVGQAEQDADASSGRGQPLPTQPLPTQPIPSQPIPTQAIANQPIGTQPGPTETSGAFPGIATWTDPAATIAGQIPLSPRTGEPTRVWPIWIASVASYLAVAVIGVATLWIYYDAISRFAEASWLMGQWPTEPGSGLRVGLAVAVTAVTLLISSACAITGYYAYAGYRWTRWSSLVAVAISLLSLLLTPLAWTCIALAVVAAGALWLPPARRYFATWQAHRNPPETFAPGFAAVQYGPLPRYS